MPVEMLCTPVKVPGARQPRLCRSEFSKLAAVRSCAVLPRTPLPAVREASCSDVGALSRAQETLGSELGEVMRFLRQAKRRYKILKRFARP